LRYGNTRELVLGLEVVLADGRVWNGLSGLRKDNTGYDLKNLFVGAEGTLGIITAAGPKLFPRPKVKVTAFVAALGARTLELFDRCASAPVTNSPPSNTCLASRSRSCSNTHRALQNRSPRSTIPTP
jgi:FAD/FMN-containing dehydrogenase